jgi:enoyl-CoA hydratase
MAEEIAANSPLAVQGTKAVLGYSESHSIEEGLKYVAQWNSSFLHSADLREALAAFAEKRAPRFSDEP